MRLQDTRLIYKFNCIAAVNNGILKLKMQHYLHQHKTNETTGYNLTKYL